VIRATFVVCNENLLNRMLDVLHSRSGCSGGASSLLRNICTCSGAHSFKGAFHGVKMFGGMNLTTDLHLVLKLSTNGALPGVPHITLWLTHGKLYKLHVKYY